MDAPYELLEEIEPGVGRLLAHNPSAFTYYGTQTYLVGTNEVAVVDPGPDNPDHVDAIVEAAGSRKLVAIACTHTHRDHSPAARFLAERTGAPIEAARPLPGLRRFFTRDPSGNRVELQEPIEPASEPGAR